MSISLRRWRWSYFTIIFQLLRLINILQLIYLLCWLIILLITLLFSFNISTTIRFTIYCECRSSRIIYLWLWLWFRPLLLIILLRKCLLRWLWLNGRFDLFRSWSLNIWTTVYFCSRFWIWLGFNYFTFITVINIVIII